MTRDYYAECRSLAQDLDGVGLAEKGAQLVEDIEAGATSGEILMALRFHLRGMARAGQSLPSSLRDRAEELACAMDEVLT